MIDETGIKQYKTEVIEKNHGRLSSNSGQKMSDVDYDEILNKNFFFCSYFPIALFAIKYFFTSKLKEF